MSTDEARWRALTGTITVEPIRAPRAPAVVAAAAPEPPEPAETDSPREPVPAS